jgi:uncharacterized integral membrane protein
MTKRTLWALVLLMVVVLVLILNAGGSIGLDFRMFTLSASKAVVLLVFTVIGIVIGVLLR